MYILFIEDGMNKWAVLFPFNLLELRTSDKNTCQKIIEYISNHIKHANMMFNMYFLLVFLLVLIFKPTTKFIGYFRKIN